MGDRCILVTGTHRSGTSLCASALRELGVSMGDRFRSADWQNPAGYWEDEDFRSRNQQMIGDWFAPDLRENPAHAAYMRKLIRERFRQHKTWGAKDTRFCFTLPTFACAFPPDKELRIIGMYRSAEAAAKSLARCWPWVDFDAAWDILRKYDRALQASIAYTMGRPPHAEIYWLWYDHFFTAPEDTVRSLARFAGVKYRPEALAVIDEALKHF